MPLKLVFPLCLLALTPLAHADTYQFTFSGSQVAPCTGATCLSGSLQWELPSAPSTVDSSFPPGGEDVWDNIKVDASLALQTPATLYGTYTAELYPASSRYPEFFEFDSNFPKFGQSIDLTLDSGSFTSGTLSSPTFLPGTYAASSAFAAGASLPSVNRLYGSLTVTDLDSPTPTSVTPEPSTLTLLGTGGLAAAGALRRRVIAR